MTTNFASKLQRCAVAPIAILLRRRHRQARCASSLRSTAPSPAAWSRCSRSPQAPLRWKTRRHNQARDYPVSHTGRCSPAGSQPTIAACAGAGGGARQAAVLARRKRCLGKALGSKWHESLLTRTLASSRVLCDIAEKVGLIKGGPLAGVCVREPVRGVTASRACAAASGLEHTRSTRCPMQLSYAAVPCRLSYARGASLASVRSQ